MGAMRLLMPGNDKVGKTILSTALSPVKTCPDRGACVMVCYALDIERRYPSTKMGWNIRTHLVKTDPELYFAQIRAELEKYAPKAVRIHVSGDFFSVPYIRRWHAIVRDHPETLFFAYTRGWRKTPRRRALNLMRQEPNMSLYASVEKGESIRYIPGWQVARIVPRSTIHGPLCPQEQVRERMGKTRKESPLRCEDCMACIVKGRLPEVWFKQHGPVSQQWNELQGV